MKQIAILSISLLSLTLLACGEDGGPDSGIIMYVTAQSGLRIRSEPSTSAAKVGSVPYGKSVQVLEQSEQTMTISGKTGHWTRIAYDGKEGWCFGGFLSATPAPKLKKVSVCDKLRSCKNRPDCKQALADASAGPAYEICVAECAGLDWSKDDGESLMAVLQKCNITL